MAMFRSLARQFQALRVAAPRAIAAPAARVAVANPQRLALVVTAGARPMSTMLPLAASPLLGRVVGASAARKATPVAVTVQVRRKTYKLKVKASVKKRFKVNKNGLVKRAQANKRHIATKKTRERIRRLGKPVFVTGKIRKNILDMLRK